jgi:hypothetical protein
MIYFATFGDSLRYSQALTLISSEAAEMGIFERILPFTERHLHPDWLKKHQTFLMNNPRGFGYWIWKPQVVKQSFDMMKEGDVLVYADSGCRLNKQGLPRLMEYIEMAKASSTGNVSFELPHLERVWNKGKVYRKFEGALNDENSLQLVGGIFIIVKTPFTIKLVNEWALWCEVDNYSYLDDTVCFNNHPDFKEHRHDQAIWSCLRKVRGTVKVQDETWYEDFSKHLDKPIHALRRRW